MVLWSLVWTTIDFSGFFLGWSGESLLMAREKQRISVLVYWKALATPQTALPAADSKLHIVAGRSPTLLFKWHLKSKVGDLPATMCNFESSAGSAVCGVARAFQYACQAIRGLSRSVSHDCPLHPM